MSLGPPIKDRKIPKISLGAYIRRGLIYGGKFAFQNWASLIVESKFTVFALFYVVFEGDFPSTSPQGAYIWRGDLTEDVTHLGSLHMEGLIFGISRYLLKNTAFLSIHLKYNQ